MRNLQLKINEPYVFTKSGRGFWAIYLGTSIPRKGGARHTILSNTNNGEPKLQYFNKYHINCGAIYPEKLHTVRLRRFSDRGIIEHCEELLRESLF